MRAKLKTMSFELLEAKPGCCALCKSQLPTEGMLHTADLVFLVRHGYLAHFTLMEARVMRELFKVAGQGFRLTTEQLVNRVYNGANEPNGAKDVVMQMCSSLRHKLLPLGMGIIVNSGSVNLVFTPPGYKRV